jgi:hypothetical protein
MSNPSWIKKHLVMKPEVSKIFDELDAYLNFCRWEMLPFNPADLSNSRSPTWKAYQRARKNK